MRIGQADVGAIGQLLRFGIAGLASASIYGGVYLALAARVPAAHATLAVPPAFAIALTFSYALHSLWSFRGHGRRPDGGLRPLRFLIVQLAQLGTNIAVTWLLTFWLGTPAWVPLLLAILIVPLASFYLQRTWVFG
ncbi:GtrA family protein [Sphingomonas aliaeris]|uniref:GtrA family protein n=1 Tax=Sphingomonas aliaeris TaxID=2759526 RepID=A0A974NUD2_9SPHN|nr:GtrA family protein [Sphingomonas aliaeris]QQV76935.1 GtrA family protein [Sphingomonas aliaeris]